jgi:hypothetical protein
LQFENISIAGISALLVLENTQVTSFNDRNKQNEIGLPKNIPQRIYEAAYGRLQKQH